MSTDSSRALIRQEPSGWWLPVRDTYFSQFLAQFQDGPPPKMNGFMREHLLKAFKYVRKCDVAIDVGAHVGFWTWDMAQRFSDVYAFEAMPFSYECLVKNVTDCPNVRTFNMALGDCAGMCRAHHEKPRAGNTGSYYIRPDMKGDIPIRSLDEQEISGCDLLKIDVEGFELHVLQGAPRMIKEYRPVIIMECSDHKFVGRYGIPIGQAERWLLKRGYKEVAYMRPDKVFVHG